MFYTVIKLSGHLKTLEKCQNHSPSARYFKISLVFLNVRRVLSQYKTWFSLLYLLNICYSMSSLHNNVKNLHPNQQ
jgi:hypothetical protein